MPTPSFLRLSAVLLLMSSVIYTSVSFATKPDDLTGTLLTQTLAPTPILSDLRELTRQIGGRPSGSAAMDKAVTWGLEKFNTAGLENVHSEKYTPPRNWLAGTERGELILLGNKYQSAQRQPLRVAAMPFSLSTPTTGLEAEIYNIGKGDKKDFEAAGDRIKDRWLLVMTPVMKTMDNADQNPTPIFNRAKKSQAAGILWLANRSGRILYRDALTFNGSLSILPAAIIEREEGQKIAQLLKQGQTLKANLILDNEIQEKPTNYNVVAEITGWDKPDEVIVLGAHLDSWDLGEGALDNGSNSVLVIDAARQMMALANKGKRPRRTVRFMLYSGEELGLYGSWFDVQNHREILDKIKTVLIYDLGSGRTTGFSLGGRKDMKGLIEKALTPISSALGPFTQTLDATMETDNFDYLLEGVPTLVANQDEKPYVASYHAETDTLDKVDKPELKRNTAIATALIWNLANHQGEFPERQSRSEVMDLVKLTKLDKDMKKNEVWDDFVKGNRGRR